MNITIGSLLTNISMSNYMRMFEINKFAETKCLNAVLCFQNIGLCCFCESGWYLLHIQRGSAERYVQLGHQ